MINVPTIFNLLIFTHKLIHDKNWNVTSFYFSLCFLGLCHMGIIEIAKENEELYYFSEEINVQRYCSLISNSSFSLLPCKIDFTTSALDILQFILLSLLFHLCPYVECFKGNVCWLAKHNCVFFFFRFL